MIGIIHFGFQFPLPIIPLGATLTLEVVSNLLLQSLSRKQSFNERWATSVLLLDIVFLTVLLYFTSGPSNPFSALYLLHVALASVVLPSFHSWIITLFAIGGFALLFPLNRPLSGLEHHGHEMDLHLWGMWVALGITGVATVYFVRHIRELLTQKEEQLSRTRTMQALASMAASAAHELATPLSTIAVSAKELEHRFQTEKLPPDFVEDIRLIRDEIDRCKGILTQMSFQSGHIRGESFIPISLSSFLESIRTEFSEKGRIRIDLDEETNSIPITVPPDTLKVAVRNLIKNALEASITSVRIQGSRVHSMIKITIQDDGPGMPLDILSHVGEPFFTTKGKDQGMGLGIFLARSILEQLGGTLEFNSEVGKGTSAIITLRKTAR